MPRISDDTLGLGKEVLSGVAEDCGVIFISGTLGKHRVEGGEESLTAFKTRCRAITATTQPISFFTQAR